MRNELTIHGGECVGTKLDKTPNNETELKEILQMLYSKAKEQHDNGKQTNFTGLLEVISSEVTIITAIHNIKSNHGSSTAGVDGKTIRDYLDERYDDVVSTVKENFMNYNPDKVRRVWIPKPGKSEKRPLGIPTVIDRVIQECVRIVVEPIAEAQMFQNSYGFRPMRSADMAVARIKFVSFITDCKWAVEGDIEKFFDNVDHNVMIHKLWNIGVRDKRVLAIIKQMLKAGVMNESESNELGTPQGGIISPLLANIYLNSFDRYISREWENKKTKRQYTRSDGKISSLRKTTKLIPAYLIRYADDWVILTNTRQNAEKLKRKSQQYLKETLKLELSEDKTHITNMRKKAVKFLGTEIKLLKGSDKPTQNGVGKWKNCVSPDKEKFKQKVSNLKREIQYLRKTNTQDRERLIEGIERINSKIRGILNYYQMCDKLSLVCRKYAYTLKYTSYKTLKRHGGKWIRAKEVRNLIGTHSGRNAHIPAIKYLDMWIGITSLEFAEWKNPTQKNQEETPYTDEGWELYWKRQKKKKPNERIDEVNTSEHAKALRMSKSKLYTFEYFMNRPYAYNRDKQKCRICNGLVDPNEARFHHISPKLPSHMVNKVINLATVHKYCHQLIHSDECLETLSPKTRKQIDKYRGKLDLK